MPATSKKRSNGGRKVPSRQNSRSGMDAISLLKKDHQTVRQLLKRLESSTENGSSESTELLRKIETELKIHTQIEEEIFYPAYKDSAQSNDDEKLYYEALEEHHVVDLVIPEIKSSKTNSDEFGAKAKVLKDIVEHHAEEEETEMFPKARKAMAAPELRDLGRQMQERKEELMAGMTGKIERIIRPFTREGGRQKPQARTPKHRAA